jgi:hypothetical protein
MYEINNVEILRIVVMMFKGREVWVRVVDARSGYYGGQGRRIWSEVTGTAHGMKSAIRVLCMVSVDSSQ